MLKIGEQGGQEGLKCALDGLGTGYGMEIGDKEDWEGDTLVEGLRAQNGMKLVTDKLNVELGGWDGSWW